jgi:4a-hydroxytetrahydrobiopterin dehydratase
MKKFSKIIESFNKKFKVDAKITLLLKTENEGEAGYLADNILGSVESQEEFIIENIEEVHTLDKKFESSEIHSWLEIGGYLQRDFIFNSFKESIDFINKVSIISESEEHHPEIKITLNKVNLKLKTHDQNKITDRDHKLAKLIDDIKNKI